MSLHSSSFPFHRQIPLAATLIIAIGALVAIDAPAATPPALLDDFSDTQHTHTGAPRLVIDDKAMGSQSHATQKCENGVLVVQGELVPGRGLPAFVSVPLLLSADAKPQGLNGYEGVRIRIKILKGIVTVQVASSEIQNFDYHVSGPVAGNRGEFSEVRIAFKEMKRAWSEQTVLNLKTITSVNLVSVGMAKDTFAYEVDEVGFY
jgi:hypothetical protein